MISQMQIHSSGMDYKMNSKLDNGSSSETLGSISEASGGEGKSQKSIPLELTAYGTTPSGKPRLFVCQICTRAFARLEHLRRHERSHTKEKPFSCGVCQRKFSRRDLLLRHAQKLHAGCADAITRLRRKSIKRTNSNTSDGEDDPMATPNKYDTPSESSPPKNKDPVNFNLNLFNSSQSTTPKKTSRRNSVKELNYSNLQKQVFNRKKIAGRGRGASFSAQSGANYAQSVSEFNEIYPATDNIEFSTPQLMASTSGDERNWLNNLSAIPGMNSNPPEMSLNSNRTASELRENSISGVRIDEIPNSNSHSSSISIGDMNYPIKSESVVSTHSFGNYDSMNMQYPMPTATMSQNESMQYKPNEQNNEYGYSFYDIPESMLAESTKNPKLNNNVLTPIKQEFEEESTEETNKRQETQQSNFDLNFLNDIDELTHKFDVNSSFLPNGYSFYGDNPSVSSSGIEMNSPSTFSPSQNMNVPASNNEGGFSNFPNQDNKPRLSVDLSHYVKNKLFTNNIRYMINKALTNYPISGIMSPTIPSNEKLESYLNNFVNIFLSHFPFIHVSKLNEYEIMNMTSNECPTNVSARVCLPLLVATIGALLANNKTDSDHLYEASRRTIHIYLESRKNLVEGTHLSANPLWLIQSLTLSVIYGLFSDIENNVYIVIRQLNALNSLVKTSIKSNRMILFSINGEDEDNFHKLSNQFNDSLFSNFSINDEIKFKNNINLQSQTRIVFMIYRLTNFLLMLYNVPLTLSLNDLDGVPLPSKKDELIWSFKHYQDFKEFDQLNHNNRSFDEFIGVNEKIIFKEFVLELTRKAFDNDAIIRKLSNVSKYGFLSLGHGLFEIKQYEEMKDIDIFAITDTMTHYFMLDDHLSGKSKTQKSYETLNYKLLLNFIKITTIIDLKLIKEQSWLKNFEELTKNFNKYLTININSVSPNDYSRIIDCSIEMFKLILFKNTETLKGNKDYFSNETFDMFMETDTSISGPFDSHLNGSSLSDIDHLQVIDELDTGRISIHSQMLFHIFTISAIFSVYIVKNSHTKSLDGQMEAILNLKFRVILTLLNKIDQYLQLKYKKSDPNYVYDNEFSNLYLHSNGQVSLRETFYVLKVGELVLSYLFNNNMKVCIFKKLATSLSQMRRFLVDNEACVLNM